MTKVLRCNDLMPGCAWEARGDSEQEVLKQAAEHARDAHELNEISHEMMAQVRAAIRDEDQSQAATA